MEESFHIGDILSITAECGLHTKNPNKPISCPVKYQVIGKEGDKFLVQDKANSYDECHLTMTHYCSSMAEPADYKMILYSTVYKDDKDYEMMDTHYRESFVYIDSIQNLSEGNSIKPAVKN
jgi:hypothetical protein